MKIRVKPLATLIAQAAAGDTYSADVWNAYCENTYEAELLNDGIFVGDYKTFDISDGGDIFMANEVEVIEE